MTSWFTPMVRFLLELAGLAAIAYTGYVLGGDGPVRWIAAVLATVAFVTFWALVPAPRAPNGLSQPARTLIGSAALLAVAAGLALAGQPAVAAALAALVVVNTALLVAPSASTAGLGGTR